MSYLKHLALGILGIALTVSAVLVWSMMSAPTPAVAATPVAIEKVEPFEHALQSADVKVLLDKGHGSAVHIGNGYFLTAAHVADASTGRLDIKLHDKSIRKATKLWSSKDYDIATSSLSCEMVKVGTPLTLTGNPMMLEDITSFGRIAGDERTLEHWKSVLVVSAPTIPGQSGGAVYNEKHEIVGITVGMMALPIGPFSASVTGYGTIVPSKTICGLLGRDV